MYSREERTRLTGEINICLRLPRGCRTLPPKIVTREELQGPLIISGCSLIRACTVITWNTVAAIFYDQMVPPTVCTTVDGHAMMILTVSGGT